MEPITCHEYMGEKEGERLRPQCSIRVHSKRSRLADPDGISAKAVLDGLTKAGVLEDDSAKFVKEVSYSQEICRDEETVIDIYWEGMP